MSKLYSIDIMKQEQRQHPALSYFKPLEWSGAAPWPSWLQLKVILRDGCVVTQIETGSDPI